MLKIKRKTKIFISLLIIIILVIISLLISEKYIKLGEVELKKSNYEKAFVNYEKAGVLNPLNSLINIKKAEIYEQTGNDRKAIFEYRKAVSKNNNIYIKTRLIELLIKNEMATDSIQYFLFSNKGSNDKEYLIASSKALFILGKKEESQKIIKELSNNNSALQRSIYYFLNGEYELAKKEIKENIIGLENTYIKAVLKSTNNLDFYKISVAEALNEIRQPYFGKIILENMLDENKEYRDTYLYLANSYLLQNNLTKAKENAEKAITKDPVYGLTYYVLSQINLKDKDIVTAEKNIELAKKYGY